MATTNIPQITWTSGGPLAPSAPAILAGVQLDWNQSFSVTFNWNGNTPQGQLAATWAAVINDSNQIQVYYATQVDPAYAQGRMQDAILRINFLERLPAEPTTLEIQCFGAGVTIPAGPTSYGTIVDPSGNIYQCTEAGVLPSGGGSITLSFAAVIPGPTPVPQTVRIFQSIPGWDSATVVSGVIGQNTETSQQAELRRQQSVAVNAVNSNTAILGNVLNVPGVLDAYVTDNPTNEAAEIGGISLPANTLYVAATGGVASAVAFAIWQKKPPGIPLYSGNNSQTVTDPNPAYSPPAPTYAITWETPAALPIYFSVVLANSTQIPANAVSLVQTAIINAFSGANTGANFTASISGNTMSVTAVANGTIAVGQVISGANVVPGTTITGRGTGAGNAGTYTVSNAQAVASTPIVSSPLSNSPSPPRARIGSTIYASQYGSVVAALGTWASVKSLQVGSANTAGAVVVGSIRGTTLSVTAVTSGTLADGQWITGFDSLAGISIGTTIVNFGSGSGGTGTYTVSNAQNISGATFTGTRNTADQITASAVNGTIGIGDVISGIGVISGTTILSQVSGTVGGAGVYVTSIDSSASSALITCGISITAVAANQNYVGININQEPTITASNIVVTAS